MDDLGEFDAAGTVRFQRLLSAPPERVWEYLTEAELLPEWLGNGYISEEIGGKIELRSGGPVVRGIVLAREPLKHLSYSWIVYMLGDDVPAVTEAIINFDLEPVDEGTRLTLTQGPIDPEYRARAAGGWHALLAVLQGALSEDSSADFMETFQRVYPEYEKRYS